MMGLFASWVAFPVLLGVLAYGCGAVVERAAGRRLTLDVRVPCGVALMIGVLDLLTDWTATVGLAVPAVLALAVAGLVLRQVWRAPRFDRAVVAAVVVFMVYAAPIVLSGMATWAGYVKLDDTATWLALVDRALTAGHTLAGLGPSTYRDTLAAYLTNGYPVGSFLPVGLGHVLLGEDIAWLTDPWMAFMAGTLALSLHRIASRTLGARGSGWWPVAVAAFAAQPALLYGYYLWGGMKEMAGAMLIAAFASAMPLALEGERRRRARALIPGLVVVWAMLAALSTGGLVWVLPGGALALLALWSRGGMRLPSPRAALAGLAVCAVAGYAALRPGGFVGKYKGVFTGGDELGNLLAPLHLRQIAGIWPAGDFRVSPANPTVTSILIVLVLGLAAGALAMAVRRADRELVLYALCALTGALLVYWIGSPWLGGKALASASPAVVFVALMACVMLTARAAGAPGSGGSAGSGGHRRLGGIRWIRRRRWLGGRRAFGLLAMTAVVAGIVWSNVLGYHDVSLAPRAQFSELADIGRRIAGQGPTLMTSYSPYGARHFLRSSEPESASELRSRLDPLLSGELLPKGTDADIDQFQLPAVLVYRTLVLRRSPSASRPPSPYRLLMRDRYWEVWQRPLRVSPPVLAHLSLGSETLPGGVPSCAAVSALARTPGVAELKTVPVENPIVVGVGTGSHPEGWSESSPEYLRLAGPGTARVEVSVPRAGRYAVWLGGSVSGQVTIAVEGPRRDGRRVVVGTARYETQEDGEYIPFGQIALDPGVHTVSIDYHGGDWRPGSGGPPATIGPLALRRQTPEQQPTAVPITAARSLCGRTLDWIEALG